MIETFDFLIWIFETQGMLQFVDKSPMLPVWGMPLGQVSLAFCPLTQSESGLKLSMEQT